MGHTSSKSQVRVYLSTTSTTQVSPFDPTCLTVYNPSPFSKFRLGSAADGGYVIVDLPCKYDLLLSAGVGGDISFEIDFCNKYHVPCVAHDGTVEKLPATHPNIQFVKKNIGPSESNSTTNLQHLLQSPVHNNVFLKMDIEGHEFDWLNALPEALLQKCVQIAIEFHSPKTRFHQQLFEKLNKTHYLVHFHNNNCTLDTEVFDGVLVPAVFECTYVHKKFFQVPPGFNTEPLPTNLDHSNCSKRELYINYAPFVHSSK